jgi:hypothetical protein
LEPRKFPNVHISQRGLKWGKTLRKDAGIYRVIVWDTYIEEEGEATIWGDNPNIPNLDTLHPISDRQSSIGPGNI